MQRDRTDIRTGLTMDPTIGAADTATVRRTTATSNMPTTGIFRRTATGNITNRRIAKPTRTATNRDTTAAAIADTKRRQTRKSHAEAHGFLLALQAGCITSCRKVSPERPILFLYAGARECRPGSPCRGSWN